MHTVISNITAVIGYAWHCPANDETLKHCFRGRAAMDYSSVSNVLLSVYCTEKNLLRTLHKSEFTKIATHCFTFVAQMKANFVWTSVCQNSKVDIPIAFQSHTKKAQHSVCEKRTQPVPGQVSLAMYC